MSSKPHVFLGSVGVVLAALLVGCATGVVEKRSGDCGAADYRCISDLAAQYRQQASELESIAQRYAIEADLRTTQNGQDSEQAKLSRELAKQVLIRAEEADQRARELRSQLPHGFVN